MNILYIDNIKFIPITEQDRVYTMNRKRDTFINEVEAASVHLTLGEPLAVNRFVKANNLKEIDDPIFFIRDNAPSPRGLLSNEIFGINKEERANTYAYIDLGEWFLHPLVYKKWSQKDKRIKSIVHRTKKYSIGPDGDFVEDEKGSTGIKFLKDNIDKIRIKRTDSRERDDIISYIYKYKDNIFMDKLVVMPAYYRDVQSKNSGRVGVGDINKLYQSVIIASRSLKETREYGLSLNDAVCGRIQETILSIYNCITGTSGDDTDGVGLSKKAGLVRGAIMSKTTDYGTRLILSAPELKVETLDDMMVDIDYSALPLASAAVNFMPFVVFNMKRFFENEFGGGMQKEVIHKGKLEWVEVKDPLVSFSEEVLKAQIKRFVLGFSNRFSPVEVPLENGKIAYLKFNGRKVSGDEIEKGKVAGESPLIDRRLTWCDVIFMAANEAVRDKHILITRYPIDSCYNTIATKIRVSTIKNTENVYVDGEFYRWYPRIREEDIGINTSDVFIDTLNLANPHLRGLGGYNDGDSVTVKVLWTFEANEEIDRSMNSVKNMVNMGGINLKVSDAEAIQSVFNLTRILDDVKPKLTNPIF